MRRARYASAALLVSAIYFSLNMFRICGTLILKQLHSYSYFDNEMMYITIST